MKTYSFTHQDGQWRITTQRYQAEMDSKTAGEFLLGLIRRGYRAAKQAIGSFEMTKGNP